MIRNSVLALVLCGTTSAMALDWVGNTRVFQSGQSFPRRGGFLEPWQPVTITTETWPIESGQQVVAVVTTNNFQSSTEYVFSPDGTSGNNAKWFLNLGPLPVGSQVNYFLRATRFGQANAVFDSNGGANFGHFYRPRSGERRGPILQWFATDYKTILARLPEVVQAGYSAIYLPPPQKSGGGGFSVGYNPVDRFDLGDRLQLGTVRTQYGTTQELQELIRVAKRFGLDVYFDMVVNHNDNRANRAINQYPDMIPEDFHINSSTNTANPEINFNTDGSFSFGMLNHDLLGLADIAHEDGNNRNSNLSVPSYAVMNSWGKPSFVRQPRTPQYYPGGTPVPEDVRQYLERWTRWLTEEIGFTGFRIDAVKHVPPGYFGWAPDQAASQNFSAGNLIPHLLGKNPDLFIFGEDFNNNNFELREYAKTGMNLLDFPLVFSMREIFNSNGLGHLGNALSNGYGVDANTGLAFQHGGLSPDVGVAFVQSHDEGPPASNNLAHAFILGRAGVPQIYFDGNNIQPGNWANFPRPGRFDALGGGSDRITRLTDANARFGRGAAITRIAAQNTLVLERQVGGQGIALIGINNRGDNTPLTVPVVTSFPVGTVLEDLTGQRPNLTVGAGSVVQLTIPPNFSATEANNGRGYVFYAPLSPKAVPGTRTVELLLPPGQERNQKPQVAKSVTQTTPAGQYGPSGQFEHAIVDSARFDLFVTTDTLGDSALVKFDSGLALGPVPPLANSPEGLATGFIPMTKLAPGRFILSGIDVSQLEDGLHLAKVRVFSAHAGPGVFQDFERFFMVRRGLGTGWKLDGDLTDFGAPLVEQTRTPSSNTNRLDAFYAANDDRYLYIGLAGRVDGGETLTNGYSLYLDVDGTASTGVNNLQLITDDSGPAARLLSGRRAFLPSGFGADFGVGVFRNRSFTSAPESSVFGGVASPFSVGQEAGLFRISSGGGILSPLPAAIATQIRANKTDPARGAEIAIPLAQLFPNGIGTQTSLSAVTLLGSTGESGQFLISNNPSRATLGGRPAPQPWVSNQVLPAQNTMINDPGTAVFNIPNRLTIPLARLNPISTGVSVTAGTPVWNAQTQRFRQAVTVSNGNSAPFGNAIWLRIQVPGGVSVVGGSQSLAQPTRQVLRVSDKVMKPGNTLRLTVEYAASAGTSFTPSFEVLGGRGIL